MKTEEGKGARREAAGLLVCTVFALLLMVCAALAGFAPPWRNEPDLGGAASDLEVYTRVDLNTAGLHELCCLPGVGMARAVAILRYRAQSGPFRYPGDLCGIEGIDPELIVSWGNMAYADEWNAEGS